MGRRQDGRIEPGQSLKSAISARAWNRAQDAADIVLGERVGFGAEGPTPFRLPSVRVKLKDKGWFGQCRFAGQIFNGNLAAGSGLFPQVPANNDSLGQFTDDEKLIVQYAFPQTYISSSSWGFITVHRPLLVCVDNDSNLFAMSGFAFTRIRVFNYLHRYARNPIAFTGQTNNQTNETLGCLDSAFYGEARIMGYWNQPTSAGSDLRHISSPELNYPNYEFRWALIHF